MATKRWGRAAWEHACSLVESEDGLPVVETGGMWTAHKLYFLCSYLVQVVRGMHGNTAFPGGLTFIDCFGGTGVCVSRDADGRTHRLPGSSVIAASVCFPVKEAGKTGDKRFSRIISVERKPAHSAALHARMAKTGFSGVWKLIERDFNEAVADVVAEIPDRSLNVAFVDPYSLDVHFAALQALASARSLDLIVLFSDRIDLQRNVEHVYYADKNSKLDAFLGPRADWRNAFDKLSDRSGGKLCEMFAALYLEQLRRLGYRSSDQWLLEGPQGPMFRLVFAAKHPLGLKYCDIARKEDYGGEVSLYG